MDIGEQLWVHLDRDEPLVAEIRDGVLREVSGRELGRRIGAARVGLRARGVGPGDRVVWVAPNGVDWVALDLAILAEGAVGVPLYDRLSPAELAGIVRDCTPTLIVVADPALGEALGAVTLEALFGTPGPLGRPVGRASSDPVTLVYTSGTSGEPKGVILTSGNLGFVVPAAARALADAVGSVEDRVLHYLPLCFAGSRIVAWTCLVRGRLLVLVPDPAGLVEAVPLAAPHWFLNVPMVLDRIRRGAELAIAARSAPVRALYRRGLTGHGLVARVADRVVLSAIRRRLGPNLKFVVCGSAPLSVETQRWFAAIGIPVLQVYGLTETTAIVTMDRADNVVPGRVGAALDGVELRIDDGELQVRGPNVFAGYWGRPEATAAAFVDGWLRTGDQADLADGSLRVTGRTRDLLVPSSGHNVAPEPLEERLLAVPGIEQVMVVGHGRPHLAALVCGDVDPERIASALDTMNADLPHYRRVRRFHRCAEPFTPENGLLTANRKLKRAAIEQRYRPEIEALYS